MSATTAYQPYYPDGLYLLELEDMRLRVRVEHDHVTRIAQRHLLGETVLPITARNGTLGVDASLHWVPMRWIWRLIGASFGGTR